MNLNPCFIIITGTHGNILVNNGKGFSSEIVPVEDEINVYQKQLCLLCSNALTNVTALL